MTHPARPEQALICHRSTVTDLITGLSTSVVRESDVGFCLRYVVLGDIEHIALPAKAAPQHTDNLWRHTCFEAFITAEDEPAYVECNFSPSGAWAMYRFDRYRTGMTPVVPAAAPRITLQKEKGRLVLEARMSLEGFAGRPLRLGLSAVIEDRAKDISYWALRHPCARPDFHHRAGFILKLD